MAYGDRWLSLCESGDLDGALELLRTIFHDPANQKVKGSPTDYLRDRSVREAASDDESAAGETDDEDDDDEDEDESDERTPSPAQGFDAIVAGFQPRDALTKRVTFVMTRLLESREDGDATQPFQPFDALVATIGDYERGSVVLDSVFLAGARSVRQYGLNHEIVTDRDSREDYGFTYQLANKSRSPYRFELEGEVIPNALLHYHLKTVLFARYMRTLFEALTLDKRFAAFPKRLPFRFVVRGNGRRADRSFMFDVLPPLTADSVKRIAPKLAAKYVEAAAMLHNDDPVDLLVYRLEEQARSNVDPTALGELLKSSPPFLGVVRALADESIEEVQKPWEWIRVSEHSRRRQRQGARIWTSPASQDDVLGRVRERAGHLDPWQYARVFWATGDHSLALDYTRRALEAPVPASWGSDLSEITSAVEEVRGRWASLWSLVPKEDRSVLQPVWDSAWEKMIATAAGSPALAVLVHELDREEPPEGSIYGDDGIEMPEDGDDDDAGDDDADDEASDGESEGEEDGDEDGADDVLSESFVPERCSATPEQIAIARAAPQAYVDAVLAFAERVRASGGSHYQDDWRFVSPRLAALGRRAAHAAPTLIALLDQWTRERSDEVLVTEIAATLFRMGIDDVPRQVHALHASNPYYMEDFYPEWSMRAPKQRLEALLGHLAVEPGAAASPAFWERRLYDSPPAYELFRARLAGERPELIDAAVAAAAQARAGEAPTLARFVSHVAARAHKADDGPLVLRALSALAAVGLDEKQAKLLEAAQLHDVARAIEQDASDADAKVDAMRAHTPNRPMALFLAAWRAMRAVGPRAGADATRDALRVLAADDLVLRKAVFAFAGAKMNDYDSLAHGKLYALLRVAEERFLRRHTKNGRLTGDIDGFDRDPLYDAVAEDISRLEPKVLAATVAGYETELAFVDEHRALSLDALAERLDRDRWQPSLWIARKLAAEPTDARVGRLLDVFDWFAGDEGRRAVIARLLWPLEAHRQRIILDPRFQTHLAWFIDSAAGQPIEKVRAVFPVLLAAGQAALAVEVASKLGPLTVLGASRSVLPAYNALGEYRAAATLLDRAKRAISPKHPDYVVLCSNIAVEHILGGDLVAAERELDQLFAMDFSQFDDVEENDDAVALFGEDLNQKLVQAFHLQMANAKYNAACLYALTARPERAIAALGEALRLHPAGYSREKLLGETDFVTLRALPEFQALASGSTKGTTGTKGGTSA